MFLHLHPQDLNINQPLSDIRICFLIVFVVYYFSRPGSRDILLSCCVDSFFLLSFSKVDPGVDTGKAGMKQLEAKEALLLMYCQAISFYLLLKSEGLAVRDHPVIGRLVEIKNMLKKVFSLFHPALCVYDTK